MGNEKILEYVVAPLEGLWVVAKSKDKENSPHAIDKSKFIWTSFIRQPFFFNEDVLAEAKAIVSKKNAPRLFPKGAP